MEPRKYSTGTKGRIKMHSDRCREFIHANTSFHLANEFIESLDPEREDRAWQRFQTPAEILPELQEWLGGGTAKPSAPETSLPVVSKRPDIKPASQIVPAPEKAALERTRAWLAGPGGQEKIAALTPGEAAEEAVRRFYRELTGREA
ncbi:MAG: hypothetical protein NTV93_05290 [Verrucomicrobia bacterium]|nr:hypothetical protein [Verrucomicrobiota bacterium]